MGDLVHKARELSPEQLGRWVRHHTETVAPPKETEGLDVARRASRGLWFDRPCANGMLTGRFALDPEGAAVVKAAIDPLAAPRPIVRHDAWAGERDPRSPATRRADALLEVVSRVHLPGLLDPPTWCDAHHVTHWADGGAAGVPAQTRGRHSARRHTVSPRVDLLT